MPVARSIPYIARLLNAGPWRQSVENRDRRTGRQCAEHRDPQNPTRHYHLALSLRRTQRATGRPMARKLLRKIDTTGSCISGDPVALPVRNTLIIETTLHGDGAACRQRG